MTIERGFVFAYIIAVTVGAGLVSSVLFLSGCDATAMAPSKPPPPAVGSMLMETPPGLSIFDGKRETKLVTPSRAQDNTPSWTPDGGIIFISDRGGSRQVWKDGVQIGKLSGAIQAQRPQQGRNGDIIFAAITPTTILLPDMHHPSNLTIYVMKADGSGLRELTLGSYPSLAPSGTWLAFTRQTENPYRRQLWRINVDGTGEKQLTFATDSDYPDANAASISPDESTIAFFSGKEEDVAFEKQSMFTYGYRNIAVMPATGGERKHITNCKPVNNIDELRVTTSCIVADGPAWIDSKSLIFDLMLKAPNDQVVTETWKVNTDGTGFGLFYTKNRGSVPVAIKR